MGKKFHLASKDRLGVLRTINNVAVFVRFAIDRGIDPEKILAGSGIHVGELDDPHRIITTAQELRIGRTLARLAPEPLVGFDLGTHHHLISKGKLGMAAMCCETAREALQMVVDNMDLVSSYFQYDIKAEGKHGRVRMKALVNDDYFHRSLFETEMVSLYTICAMLMDDKDIFKEMHIAYPAPAYGSRYARYFRCPVRFDAPEHLIFFDPAGLDKRLRHANPLTRKMLEEECRKLSNRLNTDVTVKDKIHHELTFSGRDYPTFAQLSQRINMPERTVRRRLAQEGTSYRKIVCEIRMQRAMELLSQSELSMEQIAEELGYSETAGFYHAFESWTGSAPATYRRDLH